MDYKIKWIEENLGITRNMIRRYEKEGLLKENREGKDRTFTKEDLKTLWNIRVFVKMGFSLEEIKKIMKDKNLFEKALNRKIKELEKKKEGVEKQLNFLKVIEVTNQLPSAFGQMHEQFDRVYDRACCQYQNAVDNKMERFWEMIEEIVWLHKLLIQKNQMSEKRNQILNEIYEWFQSNHVACSKQIFAENFASHMQDALLLFLFGREGIRFLKNDFLRFKEEERRDSK